MSAPELPPANHNQLTQIFNTGYVSGPGSKSLPFGPGASTIAEFVMNENPPGGFSNSGFTLAVSSPTVPGGILKYGSQRLRLQGDGTFTGETKVFEGTLSAENDTALNTLFVQRASIQGDH